MSNALGMNTAAAREVASSVSGLAEGLSFIQTEVQLARTISLNPLNFMLNPGALILSPVSIGTAASAAADLANVKATLEYLVSKLVQEATQQDQVSNSLLVTDAGWFAQAPTATKPKEIGPFEQEWDAFGIFVNLGNYALLAKDLLETAGKAVIAWWARAPAWVKIGAEWTIKGGKFLPYVGAGFSVTSVFTEWDNDYVWGNTRNIIGAGLDVLSIVTLIPPLTPASPVIAAVGLVWDVFDTVWDLGDEFWW